MRCPNPICRVVFEVREDSAATPPPPVEPYRFEGEAPAPPPEPKKPAKTGIVGDVAPLLDASTDRPRPSSQDKPTPPPKIGDIASPPPQRVASWRDEPPDRRGGEPAKLPESNEGSKTSARSGQDGNNSGSAKPGRPKPPRREKDVPPVSASDFVPTNMEPTQRELDSLETISPPRSKKALVAALGLLAGVFLIAGCVGFYFFTIFVRYESSVRASGEKALEENRYQEAISKFGELVEKFSKSEQHPRDQFLLDLSKFGATADGPQADPLETLNRVRQFLKDQHDKPFLKEDHKHASAILRKMAENMGELAVEKLDLEALAEGQKALEESNEYGRNDAAVKEISEKLDKSKIKIVHDLKVKNILAEIEKFVAENAPQGELKQIRRTIRFEQMEEEPQIVAKLKEVDALIRSKVRYVEVKDTPAPPGTEPIEPSLLVLSFTSSSPRPQSDQKRVVLALDRGVLYALEEFTGKFQWATRVGVDTTALPVRLLRTATSPEMFLVLSADRNTLMALAASDGGVVWRHKLSAPCLGRPVVVDQRAYLPTFDGRVNEIEINRGTLLGYFELNTPLSLGAVLQEGTDCLYVPADSDNVFVLDLARTPDPNKPARKKSCIAILASGHPSGSLRSEPLVLNHFDPRRQPAWGAPAPGYLVLCQTDGFEYMKLRVFDLPIDTSDAPSKVETRIRGWSWFQPCHDAEKFAFITDAGYVGLYGINQPGNQDDPIFAMRRDEIRLGAADSHLVRGQVLYALDHDFWIIAGGRLQRYYFDLYGQKLLPSSSWPVDGVRMGAPLHAGQMDESGQVLTTVTRDLTRQISLVTAVDPKNGKVLWQRQLGLDGLGDPVTLDNDALIVDRNGAVLLIEGGRDHLQQGAEWRLSESLLVDPIEGLVPGSVQIIPEGPTTVHEIGIVKQANAPGYKLAVRSIRAGALGQKPTVEVSPLESIPSLPQGTADVMNGSLYVPLVDKSLHQFKLPLTGEAGKGGPDWRSIHADDDARGHVVALKGDDVLCTDGSRHLTRWNWPATGLFKSKQSRDMAARIVAAPLVLPGETEKDGQRVCVIDALGGMTLLNADALDKNEKTWQLPGKITAGPYLCDKAICVIVDRKKLLCIDPAKDGILWQYEMPDDEFVGQPRLVGDMLLVASPKGRFVGLDPRTGQPRGPGYVLNASAAPTGTPVAAGPDTALVPLTDGTIFFLSLQFLQDRQAAMRK